MKLRHNYYVYIVECNDTLYYTGVTNDIERRLQEHNEGLNPHCFTFKRRPVTLRYSEHFVNIQQAIAYEKQLKGWGRKKKVELQTPYCGSGYNLENATDRLGHVICI
jgi:putative endonuclease